MYRDLAARRSGEEREILLELAEAEGRHAAHWLALLGDRADVPLRGDLRTRALGFLARRFGGVFVLALAQRAESRSPYEKDDDATARMAADELIHEEVIRGLAGRGRLRLSGSFRAAVFGANDGLVSNLALIMGVAGGTDNPNAILLAGVAGLVAGAGSMAAGEWISVRTQREVYEREIAIERRELAEFPEDEQRELELIYRAKGVDAPLAAAMAERLMSNPETALDTLAREELGLDPDDLGSPWGAATASFFSFALGALIPLLPFTVAVGTGALLAAAALAGVALAAVGAAISVLTGRSAWRSAMRMLLVGGGAAGVTYLVGSLVGVSLG